jgi:dCTP deaminase
MSIQSDRWIREQAIKHRMIEPFSEKQVAGGVISYGLSSYGYDLRVRRIQDIYQCKQRHHRSQGLRRAFVCLGAGGIGDCAAELLCVGAFVEYFRIPRDVLTICVGKSTYARCGIIVNVTPFEPEWEGFVTLEISNTTPLPAKVYANEGLCQILFFRSDEPARSATPTARANTRNQQGIEAHDVFTPRQ